MQVFMQVCTVLGVGYIGCVARGVRMQVIRYAGYTGSISVYYVLCMEHIGCMGV